MNTRAMPSRRRPSQRGFTLIEVLIAILIFSFGILGTVAMQARAVQFAEQNVDRSRAALLVNEMVSQLWAAQSSTPTALSAWQTKVSTAASGLPNGAGTVSACVPAMINCAVVKVTWAAPSAKTGAQRNTYATTVVIQ